MRILHWAAYGDYILFWISFPKACRFSLWNETILRRLPRVWAPAACSPPPPLARPGDPFRRAGRAPTYPVPWSAPGGALFPRIWNNLSGETYLSQAFENQSGDSALSPAPRPRSPARFASPFLFGYPHARESASALFLRCKASNPRRGLRCPLLPTAASLALPHLKASQAHWSWDCQFWLLYFFEGEGDRGGDGECALAGDRLLWTRSGNAVWKATACLLRDKQDRPGQRRPNPIFLISPRLLSGWDQRVRGKEERIIVLLLFLI